MYLDIAEVLFRNWPTEKMSHLFNRSWVFFAFTSGQTLQRSYQKCFYLSLSEAVLDLGIKNINLIAPKDLQESGLLNSGISISAWEAQATWVQFKGMGQ